MDKSFVTVGSEAGISKQGVSNKAMTLYGRGKFSLYKIWAALSPSWTKEAWFLGKLLDDQ